MNQRAFAVALAVLAFPCLLRAQGPLTPSGPPAPSMKTLSQVEPRTPISSLPFTITSPGSYYLAASLTGASGQNGISVQADNVTLDLEGFTLLGTGGSLSGITVAAGQQNLVVYNGILRGWGGNGLDAGNGLNCRVWQLLAANNGGHGLSIGANGAVQDCLALSNTGDGVRVASSCLVLNNSCHTNATAAGTAGIHATGSGNRIEGNHLAGNVGSGIQVDGSACLIVKNNVASSGGTDYNIAPGNSYGQLVQSPGPSFTNATPWANFSSSCPIGFSSCGGVCVAIATDPNNCGTCGHVCNLPNATAGCTSGNCVIVSCNSGFGDCDNNPTTGCEVNLNTSPSNCGTCGNVCALPNATAGCSGGKCVIASCNSGFGDCDGNPANGCEANLNTSFNNCGTCGHICNLQNATANCTAGSCVLVSCNSGFGDCDGNPSNGCEANLNTSVSNCGSCGRICVLPNALAGCSAGNCVIASCNAGFANCDGLASNGCEVNTTSDPNNCGACNNACAVTTHVSAVGCVSSTCAIVSCSPGFADCDHVYGNGCEVNTTTDNNNCGTCGNQCNGATQSCTSGSCKLKTGQPCTSGSQCVSGTCTSNLCT